MEYVAPKYQPDSGEDCGAGWVHSSKGRQDRLLGDYQPFCLQISSRDYGHLQGGLWDFADGPSEEEDFHLLNKMVSL